MLFLWLQWIIVFFVGFGRQEGNTSAPLLLSSYWYQDRPFIGVIRSVSASGAEAIPFRRGRLGGIDASCFRLRGDSLFLTEKGMLAIRQRNRLWLEVEQVGGGVLRTWVIREQFHKNPVVAHRGAWKAGALPQNALASLQAAIQLGCYGSEFDVHITADDSLVINHDPTYQGMEVEKHTYEQLRLKPLINGEQLPTLRRFLEEGMRQYGTRMVVEIKPSVDSVLAVKKAKLVLNLVREMGAQAWVMYISFDYRILKTIAQVDPTAETAFLSGSKSPQELQQDGIGGLDYHFSVFRNHPQWADEARKMGLTLNAWTVNQLEEQRFFLDQRFTYLTTDEPEQLLRIYQEQGK